jgi:tight adherence protein C
MSDLNFLPIVPVLTFVTTVLLVTALMPQRQRTLRDRLQPYGARVAPARERLLAGSFVERVLAPGSRSAVKLASLLAPSTIRTKAVAELARAGDPFTVEQYLALRSAAMLGLPLLYLAVALRSGKALDAMGIIFVGVLFMAGGRASSFLVRKKINARQTDVLRALPTALDLITVCMEAGLSFDSGLAKVVEKTRGTLPDEFARVLHEMQIGKARREALRDMAKRLEVRDVSSFVAAIVQADQMGMSLGPVMRSQAEDVRLRRRQRAEETAMKAPVKMLFPLVLCILPATILVVLGPGLVTMATQIVPQMAKAS